MQRQPRGAGAHGDAQSFESKQFTRCFGELNFFQHLVHLLGLRAAFKLSTTETTVASMVRGSLVKSPRDGKEIPRLLCHLAMEEFVELGGAEMQLSVLRMECQAGLGYGNAQLLGRMFLEMLQDFGDIFVDRSMYSSTFSSNHIPTTSLRSHMQSHAATASRNWYYMDKHTSALGLL